MKPLLKFALVVSAFVGVLRGQQPVLRDLSCPVTSGSPNVYACAIPVAPSSYVTGTSYRFQANVANTGASTINFNALGAKAIVKNSSGSLIALTGGEIAAAQWVNVTYDGTQMQLQAGSGGGSSYTLPIATTSVLGGIKPDGSTITVNSSTGVASSSGGGSGVTWPATNDIVLSNSTNTPAGLAPVNGDCVVGAGGVWTADSCAGGTNYWSFGTGVPTANCTPGQNYYFDTAFTNPGPAKYFCSATNVWSQDFTLGGSGALIYSPATNGIPVIDINTSAVCLLTSACTWPAVQTYKAPTGGTLVNVDTTVATQIAQIAFKDQGTSKWGIGKYTDNTFFIFDSVNNRNILNTDTNGKVVLPLGARLGIFTTGTLPTCNAGAEGLLLAVSDATSPTYNGTYTGGSTVHVPVYCDGTSWKTH